MDHSTVIYIFVQHIFILFDFLSENFIIRYSFVHFKGEKNKVQNNIVKKEIEKYF